MVVGLPPSHIFNNKPACRWMQVPRLGAYLDGENGDLGYDSSPSACNTGESNYVDDCEQQQHEVSSAKPISSFAYIDTELHLELSQPGRQDVDGYQDALRVHRSPSSDLLALDANDDTTTRKGDDRRALTSSSGFVSVLRAEQPDDWRDWNQEFQSIVDGHSHGDETNASGVVDDEGENDIERARLLRELSRAFLETAEEVVKVIVAERNLPQQRQRWRVPDSAAAGFAGGAKYVARGILFKFCENPLLPGGELLYASTEDAMKTSNAELRGVMALMSSGVKGLHFPLMALCDCLGFRIVASAILPIGSTTLKFGSCDAGFSLHNKDPELFQLLVDCGKRLNLKPHPFQDHTIPVCADMEGHLGRDGRYYAIDCARLFPPTLGPGKKRSFLVNFFRPEFVAENLTGDLACSSDALSGFGRVTRETDSADIQAAMDTLTGKVIPTLAFDMGTAAVSDFVLFSEVHAREALNNVLLDTHRAGVNFRYLGHVRSQLGGARRRGAAQGGTTKVKRGETTVSKLILAACMGRVIKCELRRLLRDVSGSACDDVICKFMSRLSHDREMWMLRTSSPGDDVGFAMKGLLSEKFEDLLSPAELSDETSLAEEIGPVLLKVLLSQTEDAVGISFDSSVMSRLLETNLPALFSDDQSVQGRAIMRLDPSHIEKRVVRFKYMNFVLTSEAESQMRLALARHGTVECEGALERALKLFQRALQVNPADYVTVCNYGAALFSFAQMLRGGELEEFAAAADVKFRECLAIRVTHYPALLLWAKLQLWLATSVDIQEAVRLRLGRLQAAVAALEHVRWNCSLSDSLQLECLLLLGDCLFQYAVARRQEELALRHIKAKERKLLSPSAADSKKGRSTSKSPTRSKSKPPSKKRSPGEKKKRAAPVTLPGEERTPAFKDQLVSRLRLLRQFTAKPNKPKGDADVAELPKREFKKLEVDAGALIQLPEPFSYPVYSLTSGKGASVRVLLLSAIENFRLALQLPSVSGESGVADYSDQDPLLGYSRGSLVNRRKAVLGWARCLGELSASFSNDLESRSTCLEVYAAAQDKFEECVRISKQIAPDSQLGAAQAVESVDRWLMCVRALQSRGIPDDRFLRVADAIQDMVDCLSEPLVLEVGNLYESSGLERVAHRWTMFVRAGPSTHFSMLNFVSSCVFKLHPTFNPPVVAVTRAPFKFTRNGWGTFTVQVRIQFGDVLGGFAVDVNHELVFERGGHSKFISIDLQKLTVKQVPDRK